MFIASVEERCGFVRGEFVRCAIACGRFHEHEWAIVGHEMVSKKRVCGFVPISEQAPKSSTTDFTARTVEAEDGPFGVFVFWFFDGSVDVEKIACCGNFAEGDAGLCHAPRPGVHAQEQYAFGRVGELFEVLLMGGPGVVERVIDMRDRVREGEFVHISAEGFGGVDDALVERHDERGGVEVKS